jgi:hypothetical protein
VGSKQKTLDGKRTLTDLRGVGGFGSILSSKHFGRTPHGMAKTTWTTREGTVQALSALSQASVGIINLFGKEGLRKRKEIVPVVTDCHENSYLYRGELSTFCKSI